jgi:hypothetical protein
MLLLNGFHTKILLFENKTASQFRVIFFLCRLRTFVGPKHAAVHAILLQFQIKEILWTVSGCISDEDK